MTSGWRYRVAGAGGTLVLVAFAVAVADNPVVQALAGHLPVVARLPADGAMGYEYLFEAATTAAVFLVAFIPLYKPRPRRILDTAELAEKRAFLALVALAAIGYFDYTYRLPRLTLVLAGAFLLVALPAWFVAIRRRPQADGGRAVLVGDDPEALGAVLAAMRRSVVGYVAPASVGQAYRLPAVGRRVADGGLSEEVDGGPAAALADLPCLGGLSRLDEVLVEYDVDTAVLAFSRPDRAEFFGALDACFRHGVAAKVHREHADSVLTREMGGDGLVDIDLEPWDPQDHVVKRLFDIAFALVGLVVLAPVAVAIAVAIKVDDGGSVLYGQERTAAFGDTFRVRKFRTMRQNTGDMLPIDDAVNSDITHVGGLLRRTHLDEIPQLWAILLGEMSVVGPRAVWTEEEPHLADTAATWSKRWFVKPGLTGLAQVHDVTSTDPEAKLRYDIEYIRRQSFWFDLKLVVRQLWNVGAEVAEALRTRP